MRLFLLGSTIWSHTINLLLTIWTCVLPILRQCSAPIKAKSMSQQKQTGCIPNKQFPVIVKDNKSGFVHLSKLIPSIKVPFYGVVGSVKSVKKLKSGSWYVECHSQAQQDSLLATKDLAGVSVSCYVPTLSSDGVVYGVTDPLALSQHPDVIRFQITSNTNNSAKSYTTRIIFAKEVLPTTIAINGFEYEVHPYTPPTLRCTNCQRLSHTKQACEHPTRCSRCGGGHPRASCHAHSPKCVNCQGPHSAAFYLCPKKKESAVNLKGPKDISDKGHQHENMASQSHVPSYASKVLSFNIPSFITFISVVVLPILALDRNVNIISQLIKIYKALFKLSDNDISNSINNEVRSNAESLMRAKSTQDSLEREDELLPRNIPISVYQQQQSVDTDQTDRKKDRKQLVTLKNINLKKETQNVILGDSTTKGITDDPDLNTESFCIPGLIIEDVQEWLKNSCQMSLKNFVFHLGVNSCRKKSISDKIWDNVIQLAKVKLPQANIHFSSILPGKGSLKKNIDRSNSALKLACDKAGVFFLNNRSHFAAYTGQPLVYLYSRDGVHPNKVGTSILTKNLFSVLENE